MGLKTKLKYWLALKLRNLLLYEKLPIKFLNNSNIEVGKDSFHNGNFEIRGNGRVKIGSFCAFGKNVKFILSNHNYDYPVLQYTFYSKYFQQKPEKQKNMRQFMIEIGSDVWIGDNVSILPNVKIGHGAIIGTCSVVTKDVAPYTIVGGVPAKFLKNRFSDDTRILLLDSKWWDWSDQKIIDNKEFFFKNFNEC